MTLSLARPLVPGDIPGLIALARESLPDTMASRLGDRFAVRYFTALLAQDEVEVDGYFLDGALVGFIIYTVDCRSALQAVFRRHAVPFTLALLPALLSPTRLGYVIRIARSVLAGGGEAGDDVPAELLTMGVRQEARGQRRPEGSVAHELVQRAFARLAAAGAAEVKVFCKPEEIEPVANRFMVKQGFVLRGRVKRFGVPANLYVKPLAAPGRDRPR